MAVVIGTDKNFDAEVASGVTLVDFYADWCGPCKMIAPVLTEMANERSDVKIVKVNVDVYPTIAQKFGVQSIPTLILFKDGQNVAQTLGFQPKQALEGWIDSHK